MIKHMKKKKQMEKKMKKKFFFHINKVVKNRVFGKNHTQKKSFQIILNSWKTDKLAQKHQKMKHLDTIDMFSCLKYYFKRITHVIM